MPGHRNGPRSRTPEVVLGEVDCVVATSAMLEGTDLAGSAREASRYLAVSVPVTVRSEKSKAGPDLVVSARLHAPRGCPAPAAWAPSPSVEYVDVQKATNVNVSISPGIGTLSHGQGRTTNHRELVSNVGGVGTALLEWTIPGRHGHTAGSREFRFFVRQDEVRHSWLELTARAGSASGFLRRASSEPPAQRVWSPLIAESSPQAASTLVLFEGHGEEHGDDSARFYVGRPLDLPIALTEDGPAVTEPDTGSVVVGSFRWFDDVDGRPGFQWVQKAPDRTVLGGGPESEIPPGTTMLVPDGGVLRFPGGRSLRVAYDGVPGTGRPTLQEVLDVSVVVDGVVVATHRTESGYVTIGRSLKDISVDRPDISRTHGSFELSGGDWSYTHLSGTHDAELRRAGQQVATLRRGSVTPVPVRRDDTVVLNDHVSLSIG